MNINNYDYFLPKENFALIPAVPRDFSKLFIYDTIVDKITFDYFYNIDKYLSDDSFIVMNDTKVLPARVEMKKESGGKVIVLFLVSEPTKQKTIKVMIDRKVNIGEKLYFQNREFVTILGQNNHIFTLKYNFSKNKLFNFLKKYGTAPIPLYLKKTPLKKYQLIEKYQTIFAKKEGSSAAPTASLHFTRRVLKKLEKKGIERYFITLHVGLGTFSPITEENLKTKKLHQEYYEVSNKTFQSINRLKREGKKLVAIGTTVVRTLESKARQENFFISVETVSQSQSKKPKKNLASLPLQKTDLFIYPPYDFKMVDSLITNFHLPKSSLMMLVEAFLQFKKSKRSLVELYNIAIKNKFRFYSFGDAMLII